MPLPPRGRIFDSITDTVGGTPLLRMSRIAADAGISAELLGKLEFFNPIGSLKDRIAVRMIDQLEASGQLRPGGTVIEPSSGNTGIGLAFVCAARGYRLVVTMPESNSVERRRMVAILGAELVLTDAEDGMPGAIDRANELLREIPDAVMPHQFENPSNPDAHEESTGQEILVDTGGALDVLVAGIGTGGSITGAGRLLKRHNPALQIVAVEPEDSPVLSGGEPGPHSIQGLGPGFNPDVLDRDLLDRVVTIGNATSFETARKLAALEGVPAGISSGAAVAAALEIAQEPEMQGKRMVIILPSFAERYLSTPLFEGF